MEELAPIASSTAYPAAEFSREKFQFEDEQKRYIQWYREEIHKKIDADRTKPILAPIVLLVTVQETNWDDEESHRQFCDTAVQIPDDFPIGTLIGGNGVETPLQLCLGISALDAGYVRDIDTGLPWAVGGALAIKHDLKDPSDDSTMGMEEFEERGGLFRFRSLGWVLREQETEQGGLRWKETGHILVIGLHRKLHPWFVLAEEWYDYDKGDAGESVYLQPSLQKGERYGPGILPGDTHWTPVGKLKGNFSGKIQSWFHKDARFEQRKKLGLRGEGQN
ncbi:hypothetical protein MMC11_002768 [Xylographa trunciseda]|nr:hypothetical protein [Xylographa trunciseda]